VNETIAQLIEFLKSMSPLIWAALIKQVYIEAISKLAWGILFLVVAAILKKVGDYGNKIFQEDAYSDWEDGRLFAWGGAVASVIITFAFLVSAAMWFANPEFYAIRFILEKIHGG
jgi:hypothetical protein